MPKFLNRIEAIFQGTQTKNAIFLHINIWFGSGFPTITFSMSYDIMTIGRSQKQESKFRFLTNTKNCDGTEGARVAMMLLDITKPYVINDLRDRKSERL